MANLESLVKATYDKLWEPSDITSSSATEVVIPKINDVIRRICSWKVYNLIEWGMIQGKYLPFLAWTKIINTLTSRILTQEVLVWDTKLYFDTTDLASSGSIIMWEVIFSYTVKTSTYIEIPASEFTWEKGTVLRVLYDLPTDIDEPQALRQWNIEIWFVNDDSPITWTVYYSIISGKLYIKWVIWKIVLKYKKKPTDLVDNTDECIIPDAKNIIACISAGEVLYDLEETNDAQSKLVSGYSQLKEFYAKQASQVKKQNTIMSQPFNLQTTYAKSAYKSR